jgi:hypothetical protein
MNEQTDTPTERLIRTIYVSNVEKVDVFRIHVFENSLKFDSRFAYGVAKNQAIYEMVCEIEALWQRRVINMQDIFTKMIDVLTQHEEYLKKYYFCQEELDFNGKLYGIFNLTAKDEKEFAYYMCLKNKDNLKKIDRKEFEAKMQDQRLKNIYIENYYTKDVQFYNYRISSHFDNGRHCYLMLVGQDLKLGYVEN